LITRLMIVNLPTAGNRICWSWQFSSLYLWM